ncbi:hypothetical protein [Empedobacter tilapiae]|uniref:Uncharacterized protein n=1 Tax=Empedobacter tilapiae TaxID=2491114 RepID=A0A4Z1B7Q2_9FLAO|nr:hypothetical protein [Empedobacter tilapiae]TGN24234.1 hypothetical protein E4J94_13370 [Empedobacter tilapiae]
MKKHLIVLMSLFSSVSLFSQVGINTENPQKTLHVNGDLQLTKEFNVGGNASTQGSPGVSGQVLVSKGANSAPEWKTLSIPTLPDLATGTVISIDGQLMIAQEITLQMTADYTNAGASSGPGVAIGNLNNEIIDNENTYLGTTTSNSFKVSNDGIYHVNMNMQISTTNNTSPVIGVWDNTVGNWVARVSDQFVAATGGYQTFTLITAIPMLASHTYSFRFLNTTSVTIKHLSSGFTGSGPVSQVTLKRLR